MLGIECDWECGGCGDIQKTYSLVEKRDIPIKCPDRCVCGKSGKAKLRIVGFRERRFKLKE